MPMLYRTCKYQRTTAGHLREFGAVRWRWSCNEHGI